jgi:hypothetical protein
MAAPAWDDNYPQDSLSAKTLHTILQNVKQLIGERMVSLNTSGVNEHDITTGRHEISRVGFVQVHSKKSALDVAIQSDENNTLHYCTVAGAGEDPDDKGLYISRDGVSVKIASLDHGSLIRDEDSHPHSRLLKKAGGNAMLTDMTTSQADGVKATTFGTEEGEVAESGDSMLPTHKDLNWFDAHGADSLDERHFPDDNIPQSRVPYTETDGSNVTSDATEHTANIVEFIDSSISANAFLPEFYAPDEYSANTSAGIWLQEGGKFTYDAGETTAWSNWKVYNQE